MNSILTRWLDDPHPGRGIHLADNTGDWAFTGYRELAATAGRVAAALVAAGVRRGDPVAVLMPTGYPVVTALFGVLAAGAAICPIVPPAFQAEDDYVAHVAAILARARPVLTITTDEFAPLVTSAMAAAGQSGEPWLLREAAEGISPRRPGDIALLQFTSGSTGTPRGVRVSWDNLAANLAVCGRMTGWGPDSAMASWLPLYHDMGLIGCFLFPVSYQGDLWLMRPDQFIRDPARWLACFGPGRASVTASPSFAFGYAVRRLSPERIARLDLSGWRSACVGAEPTDVAALDAFARLAAPAGFSPRVFQPSYGLAENTLAVTSPVPGEVPRILRPDWAKLRLGDAVQVSATARLGTTPVAPGSGWLIGHGRPAPSDEISLRIIDDHGEPLPEGHLGEIAVAGTSMAQGYDTGRGDGADQGSAASSGAARTRTAGVGASGGSSRFVDGELRTGDAGFVHDGELYVLGRMGDSLTLRGRNVYVEDLDARAAAAARLPRSSVVVVSTMDAGRVGVAVFAETRPGPWADDVVRVLRGELGPDPAITIVTGTRGLIRRTSSGKPRRRQLWHLLQSGELPRAHVRRYP